MTNETLVRKAQAGDVPSREALACRWLARVYGAALAQTRNAADADDLTQEAFLRAFRSLATLKDPARFGPWLLRIVRNAARDRWRRPAAPGALGEGADAVADTATGEAEGDAVRAWRALPGEERLVTWLKVMDGLRFEDIAELLGTSKSAAFRTFRKGLARLRKELSRC
jgi:RNA polymerase sigma-70 factor (ECF subfamily)